jgi:hypothetical protein
MRKWIAEHSRRLVASVASDGDDDDQNSTAPGLDSEDEAPAW